MKTIYPYNPVALLICCLLTVGLSAQIFEDPDAPAPLEYSKVIIKGFLFEEGSRNPIEGAIVDVTTVYPRRSAKTQYDGSFEIRGIPYGTHKIVIEAEGFEIKEVHSIVLSEEEFVIKLEILIRKDFVLSGDDLEADNIPAHQQRRLNKTSKNVSVSPRDLPVNELAISSVRSFKKEDFEHFAGSRQDPLRAIANYSGLHIQDDYQNSLIVRGSSPDAFQWRLEGIPIPNPNHLGDFSSSGGVSSILSNQVLSQSDVLLGAFSAEYGNVTAGIFDARLRKVKASQISFSGQVSTATGIELLTEGPIKLKGNNKSNFFFNYRHSKFNYLGSGLAHVINPRHFRMNSMPNTQDLAFKVEFETENVGNFSFFGLGGIGERSFNGLDTSIALYNQFVQLGQVEKNNSLMGVLGLKHQYYFNQDNRSYSYIEHAIAGSYLRNKQSNLLVEQSDSSLLYNAANQKSNLVFSGFFHRKVNQNFSFRIGLLNETSFINLDNEENSHSDKQDISYNSLFKGNTNLLQGYSLLMWKPLINFKCNLGLHTQWLALTNSYSIEPRLAFRWELSPLHFVSLGYGLHSQMQPFEAYFSNSSIDNQGHSVTQLQALDFTRVHHFVLGYDFWINNEWRFHAELYHQEFFNVPVDSVNTTFSMLNYNGGRLSNLAHLVNEGEGHRQGFEFSVERYFNKGIYALLSASFYDAKYTDYYGIERDVQFNNHLILNTLIGKSFYFGMDKQNSFSIDMRLTYGGRGYSYVVDPVASLAEQQTVYFSNNGSSKLTAPYFRSDIKLSVDFHNPLKKQAHSFYLDVLNFTNSAQKGGSYFDLMSQTVQSYYQMPLLFDFGYQFKF